MLSSKLIVANWKANKTKSEALAWWQTFSTAKFSPKKIHVVICPAYVYLFPLSDKIKSTKFPFPVTLGTQDISAYPGGTYTGEVTARMVSGLITHAILGHSERRRWFQETQSTVAQKTVQSLDNSITPIISVDKISYRQQLIRFDKNQLKKIIIMYEPPEAISRQEGPIGQGQPADKKDVEIAISDIKLIAADSPILYGGSVKSYNANRYLSLPGISGVVAGTAGQNVDEFISLINQI
jgi:triosephosphate isomerase